MLRSPVLAVLLTGLLLLAAGAAWGHSQRTQIAANAGDVGIAHPVYAIDPGDDRALAAYASDIFVGKVLAQTGNAGAPTSAPGQEVPQTQFAVAVLRAIKGRAAGVVTVNQVGGIDRLAQRLMVLEGDALLRPGTSELFLVSAVPERGWYQIVAAGHGHRPVAAAAERDAPLARVLRALGEPARVPAAAGFAQSQAPSSGESIDFIRFNGAVYLSAAYLAADTSSAAAALIDPQDLGPTVGQVSTNWIDPNDEIAYPNEPCHWEAPDGAAPWLAPGDTIYAVRGYATTFRLAARQGDRVMAYQVWCNEQAEVGADLFDVYDRVARIRVTADLSESSGWADITDRATVDDLVAMLLAGRVVPEDLASAAPVSHQMIVYLDDGSAFRASAAPGEFLWGVGVVEVPAAFTAALDRAWRQHLAAQP
jgi:hypothetical protein